MSPGFYMKIGSFDWRQHDYITPVAYVVFLFEAFWLHGTMYDEIAASWDSNSLYNAGP